MRITWHTKLLIGVTLLFLFIFMFGDRTFAVAEVKLLASDGAVGDGFGVVSISGDVALVGTWSDDNGTDSGSAYVFRWNGSKWVEEQKLLASDGAAGDKFGTFVSINGNVALVGAPQEDKVGSNSGKAYVFRWNGSSWVEEQILFDSNGADGDLFGWSVSISGDVALVGASEEDAITDRPGKAYVFRWNGSSWVEEQKLLASDGANEDSFGVSVSISGDVALVGADEDGKGNGSGKAYVFRWNGSSWVEEQKLLASDGTINDAFGARVSISADVALVGAPQEETIGFNPGKAYVFRRNGSNWAEEQKLLASDGAAGDGFGTSVSISGDVVMVGAFLDDDNGTDSGSAYVYALEAPSAMSWMPLLLFDD